MKTEGLSFFQTLFGADVCPAPDPVLSWIPSSRSNWLPFKPALTDLLTQEHMREFQLYLLNERRLTARQWPGGSRRYGSSS
jgi:hypothetical protein